MAQVKNTPKSQLVSQTSEAVNVIRGVMILILVFVHWSPGVFERLAIDYQYITNPFFRLATPGFAIIFGIATGLYTFSKFEKDPINARIRIRFGLKMVLTGLLILAVVRYFDSSINGHTLDVNWPVTLFFSVLAYYFLALLTLPLWYFILAHFKRRALAAAICSILFFATAFLIKKLLPTSEALTGFTRLGGLMVEAKYNYFSMSGIVFMGIALGIYIKQRLDNDQKSNHLYIPGLMIVVIGTIASLSFDKPHTWFTADMTTVWMNLTYFGLIVLLLWATIGYIGLGIKNCASVNLVHFLAVLGSISLRVFIGHALVIPIKNLFVSLGLPYSIALSLSIFLFFIAMLLPARKIYKKYYGSS
mgnify:CR=1 FL=1